MVNSTLPEESPAFAASHTGHHDPSPSWWRRFQFRFATADGLLLMIGAQVCFALMNVVVKILNSLDPPIPPIEVCTYIFLSSN